MPELAEVEYYRKQWDPGLGERVERVALHRDKRIFRGADVTGLQKALTGAQLISSVARGKQMLFRFSGDAWLGIHLGMTGKLTRLPASHEPGKHDHLSLFQPKRTLVFNDPRLFGRVRFEIAEQEPEWWTEIPVAPNESGFTLSHARKFLERRSRLPVKAALLLQEGFPGIGNWMADEILWRAELHPARKVGELESEEVKDLWKQVRHVSREALRTISTSFGDPPKGWLFHERWSRRGLCPKHKTPLKRVTVGGRTSAFCDVCQPHER